MASQTEGLVLSDVIKFEEESRFSREVLTLAASQTISMGEVLQASGDNVVALASAASASAVALEAVTTGVGVTSDILCAVRHCVLTRENLTYNSEDEDDTDAVLKALGMVVRQNAVHDEA